ncbi:MAG TPA: ribonuclease J [Patescibacteria group bacterium]|nr:ribonuclease J [Patescibacteria group bacterium]
MDPIINNNPQIKPQKKFFTKNKDFLSIIPLGGLGDVTRNMYLYEYKDQILIVDCGIGFADETMLGVDLLLPDIAYLLKNKGTKKIVGLVFSHGHEDHIGAIPFILPQLQQAGYDFPMYGTPLTAAFANSKLTEFEVHGQVTSVPFDNREIKLGPFSVSFMRVTHSIPDSSHILIKTPIGNLYHGADYKFDLTPYDGKKTDFTSIAKAGEQNLLCVSSDCLGAERTGFTPSEQTISADFEREVAKCKGKCIITTYSSNISRLNQAIAAAEKYNRKVCFVGRSLIKNKEIGQRMGYLQIRKGTEVEIDELKNYPDKQLLLLVAGSQGQQNSGMNRIANGEHREIKLAPDDVIIFSSDPIPGNEVSVNDLVDTLSKSGARVLYTQVSDKFHVSGHGSSGDLMLLMSLTKARLLLPIGGTYKQMVAYRQLAETFGYKRSQVILAEDGQEVQINADGVKFGKRMDINNVYVDQLSGEEVESFVLRDRERLAKDGIVIIMAEVRAEDGQLVDKLEIVSRGFSAKDNQEVQATLGNEIQKNLALKKVKVTNWVHMRQLISEVAGKQIFKQLRRRPLILPVVVEV